MYLYQIAEYRKIKGGQKKTQLIFINNGNYWQEKEAIEKCVKLWKVVGKWENDTKTKRALGKESDERRKLLCKERQQKA